MNSIEKNWINAKDNLPAIDYALDTTYGYISMDLMLLLKDKTCCIGWYTEDGRWVIQGGAEVEVLCWMDLGDYKRLASEKQYVIAGMAGIGKSTLAKLHSDLVADVESSNYRYINTGLEHLSVEERKGMQRRDNPEWPDNYIQAIKKAMKEYKIVCIQLHPDNYEACRKADISFIVVYPERKALDEYWHRLQDRGNSIEFADKIVNTYDDFVLGRCLDECDNERWILKKGETLEDRLEKIGVLSF